MNKPSQYLNTLFKIKKSMIGAIESKKDLIWIDYYNQITSNGWNTENLPHLLALIHPDFYYRNGLSIEDNLPWKRNGGFLSGILHTSKCMARVYINDECIFNSIPEIREKCHADHRWPNSLGGPSILDNRLILCKYHNGMKGNDIYNFHWDEMPTWLKNYLEQIYRLKT